MASAGSASTLISASSSSRLGIFEPDGREIEASGAAAPAMGPELKSRIIKLDKDQQARFKIVKDKMPLYRDYLNAVNRRFIGLQNKYKLEPTRVILFGSALHYVLHGGEEPKEIDMRLQIAPKYSWTTTASKVADWVKLSLPKVAQGFTSHIKTDHGKEYSNFEIHHPRETHYTDLTIEHAHTPNRTHAEFTSSRDSLRATINLQDEDFSTLELHVAQNAFQVMDVLNWNEKGRMRVHPEHAGNTKDGLLRIITHLTAGALFDQPSEIIDNLLCETLIEQYKDNYTGLERKIEKIIDKKYKKDKQGAVFFLLNLERFFSKSSSALVKQHRSRIQTIILNAFCKKRLGCFDLNVSEEGNLLAFCRYYLDNVAAKMVSETGENIAYGKYFLLPFQTVRIKDQCFIANERLCNELEKIFPPKDPDWRTRLSAEAPKTKVKLEEKAPSPKKAGKASEATFKTIEEFLDVRKKQKNPLQSSNQLYTLLSTQPTPPQRKAQLASVMDNLIVQLMKDPKNASNIYNLILAFFKSIEGQPLQNRADIEKWISWFLENGLSEDALRLFLAAKDSKILDGINSTLIKMSKKTDNLPGIASFLNTLYAFYNHYEKKEELAVLERLCRELFNHVPNESRFYFYNLTRESIDQFSSPTYFAIFSSIVTYTDWDNLSEQTRARFEKFASRSLSHLNGKKLTLDPEEDLKLLQLINKIKPKGIYLREDCLTFLRNQKEPLKGLKEALAVLDTEQFRLEKEIRTSDEAIAFLKHLADDDFEFSPAMIQLYGNRLEEINQVMGWKKTVKYTEFFDEAEENILALILKSGGKNLSDLEKLFNAICMTHFTHLVSYQKVPDWQAVQAKLIELRNKTNFNPIIFYRMSMSVIDVQRTEMERSKNTDLCRVLHSPFFQELIDRLYLVDKRDIYLKLVQFSLNESCAASYAQLNVEKLETIIKGSPDYEQWFRALSPTGQYTVETMRTQLRKTLSSNSDRDLEDYVRISMAKIPIDPMFLEAHRALPDTQAYIEISQKICDRVKGKDLPSQYYALLCMAKALMQDKIDPDYAFEKKSFLPKENFERALGFLLEAEGLVQSINPQVLRRTQMPQAMVISLIIVCLIQQGKDNTAIVYYNKMLKNKEIDQLEWYALFTLSALFQNATPLIPEHDHHCTILMVRKFLQEKNTPPVKDWLHKLVLALVGQNSNLPHQHPNYNLMKDLAELATIYILDERTAPLDARLREIETKLAPIVTNAK